jgi:hypothetical protein
MLVSAFVETGNLHSETNNETTTHPIAAQIDCGSANCGRSRFPWTIIVGEIDCC